MSIILPFPLRRFFIALPLEGEVKCRFQAIQDSLKEYADILSFQNPQSPHLTLNFWPEVMQIEYDRILKQAEEVAAKSAPFSVKIEGVSTFGSRGEDRVLFLDIPFSDELARFKKLCPWPSEKPFDPHLTLARIRHPQRFIIAKKKILKALDGISFTMPVDRLRAYAEVEGRKQTALQDFPFSKS